VQRPAVGDERLHAVGQRDGVLGANVAKRDTACSRAEPFEHVWVVHLCEPWQGSGEGCRGAFGDAHERLRGAVTNLPITAREQPGEEHRCLFGDVVGDLAAGVESGPLRPVEQTRRGSLVFVVCGADQPP
jgi:hypothetical protein